MLLEWSLLTPTPLLGMFEAVSEALPLANLFLHGQRSICTPLGYPLPTRALGCRRAVGSSIMPLLALPAEILDLILQNVSHCDASLQQPLCVLSLAG